MCIHSHMMLTVCFRLERRLPVPVLPAERRPRLAPRSGGGTGGWAPGCPTADGGTAASAAAAAGAPTTAAGCAGGRRTGRRQAQDGGSQVQDLSGARRHAGYTTP